VSLSAPVVATTVSFTSDNLMWMCCLPRLTLQFSLLCLLFHTQAAIGTAGTQRQPFCSRCNLTAKSYPCLRAVCCETATRSVTMSEPHTRETVLPLKRDRCCQYVDTWNANVCSEMLCSTNQLQFVARDLIPRRISSIRCGKEFEGDVAFCTGCGNQR